MKFLKFLQPTYFLVLTSVSLQEHPYDRNIFQELQPPQEPVPPLPELYVIRTVESEDEIEPIPGCEVSIIPWTFVI